MYKIDYCNIQKQFELIEVTTGEIIKQSKQNTSLQYILNKLNSGSGFAGCTPAFFNTKYS